MRHSYEWAVLFLPLWQSQFLVLRLEAFTNHGRYALPPPERHRSSPQPDHDSSPHRHSPQRGLHTSLNMAEVVGIIAGIGSVLKTLTSTGVYVQGVGSASREAQQLVD
jgi:hypothetical protein